MTRRNDIMLTMRAGARGGLYAAGIAWFVAWASHSDDGPVWLGLVTYFVIFGALIAFIDWCGRHRPPCRM